MTGRPVCLIRAVGASTELSGRSLRYAWPLLVGRAGRRVVASKRVAVAPRRAGVLVEVEEQV